MNTQNNKKSITIQAVLPNRYALKAKAAVPNTTALPFVPVKEYNTLINLYKFQMHLHLGNYISL